MSMESECAAYLRNLDVAPFATIVPDRWPAVKFHGGLGRAKSALTYRGWGGARGGEVYERTSHGWALLYRVERGTAAADLPWRGAE